MNSITFSSTNLLQNYVAPNAVKSDVDKQSVPVAEKPAEQQTAEPKVAPEIMSKEAAEASKTYAFVAPKFEPYPKLSLPELKADLIAKGKVEGPEKDFKVEQDADMSKLLVFNEGKPSVIYRFDKKGENKKDFVSVEEIGYPMPGTENGVKKISTVYGPEHDFHFRTITYEKNNPILKDEIVNNTTTSHEFKDYLISKSIPFAKDLEITDNNTFIHKFILFENDKVSQYVFAEDENSKTIDVSKKVSDTKGNTEFIYTFGKDETDCTVFEDNAKY